MAVPGAADDFHLHVQPWDRLKPEVVARWKRTQRRFDDLARIMKDPRRLLAMLDEAGVARACLVNYASPAVMGFDESVNDFVARYCAAAPERLLPVGGIDPANGRDAKRRIRRVLALGIRMVKVHPPHQGVFPNDYLRGNKALQAVYEACQKAGVPVMIHTGTSVFPGARSRFGDPLGVEDVAVDFPELTLVLAHAGRPLWTETAVFLARRFERVFLDLSSIPPQNLPKYIPRLEELSEKCLFGTDWPAPGVPGIRENVEAFERLPLSVAARSRILQGNSRRLLPCP